MTLIVILLVVVAWCVLPLPLAVALGRVLRASAGADPRRRDTYDLGA